MILLLYLFILIFFLIILKNKLFISKKSFNQQYLDNNTYISRTTPQVVDNSYQDLFSKSREQREAEETDNYEEYFSSEITTPGSLIQINIPQETTSPLQQQQQARPQTTQSRIIGTTPEEDRRQNQQEEERIINEQLPRLTLVSNPDDKCCGVNIYPTELENINKCIVQHIQKGDPLSPTYNQWNEINEQENTCRNPHTILSKTSNCNIIMQKYRPNIDSILSVVNDSSQTGCPYKYSIDNSPIEGSGLTPNQMLTIFRNRVRCESGKTKQEVPYGNTGFNIIRCI